MPSTEDPPSHPGAGPHAGPPVGQWAPGYPAPRAPRSRIWPAIALGAMVLALVSTVVAVVALVAATSRSSGSSPAPTSAAPTYSAAEVSAAHQKLCDAYKLEARSVEIDTNGTDKAVARVALANGAGMLADAAEVPALDAKDGDAARALATAYRTANALGSVATDAEYRTALDDIVAKDATMRRLCAGS